MNDETTSVIRQAIISTPWITLWVSEDGYMGILDMQQKVSVENMGDVMDQVVECMEEWHPPQLELRGEENPPLRGTNPAGVMMWEQRELFKEGEV